MYKVFLDSCQKIRYQRILKDNLIKHIQDVKDLDIDELMDQYVDEEIEWPTLIGDYREFTGILHYDEVADAIVDLLKHTFEEDDDIIKDTNTLLKVALVYNQYYREIMSDNIDMYFIEDIVDQASDRDAAAESWYWENLRDDLAGH